MKTPHRVATLAAAVLVAASGCTGSVSENGLCRQEARPLRLRSG